jgi:hypothetical protein
MTTDPRGSCIPVTRWTSFPAGKDDSLLGATSIESGDRSTVYVRGALELLTLAHSVLPALAEARILEFNSQVRPALPDNLPALHCDRGRNILRFNGLYRHGFLLTPVVVEEALSLLSVQGQINRPGRWPCLGERSPDIPEFGLTRRCPYVRHRTWLQARAAGASNAGRTAVAALAANSLSGSPQ